MKTSSNFISFEDVRGRILYCCCAGKLRSSWFDKLCDDFRVRIGCLGASATSIIIWCNNWSRGSSLLSYGWSIVSCLGRGDIVVIVPSPLTWSNLRWPVFSAVNLASTCFRVFPSTCCSPSLFWNLRTRVNFRFSFYRRGASGFTSFDGERFTSIWRVE